MSISEPIESLIFKRSRKGRLKIGLNVLEVFAKYKQESKNKPEAGGILLGRHILNSDDIVIDEVTTPLVGDRQERFRFFRSQQPHQEAINTAWNQSNGTCIYLGEWHTHPEEFPTPSLFDRLDWTRKLLTDKYSDPLFFVIVGTKGFCVLEGNHNLKLKLLIELK